MSSIIPKLHRAELLPYYFRAGLWAYHNIQLRRKHMRTVHLSSGFGSILANVMALFAALFIAFPTQAEAPIRSSNDIHVTAEMFSCIYDLPKVRNTFLFHSDPKKLKEAIRIFTKRVSDTEYPVGTVMQLVPFEAMVKHSREYYPDSNGWEFLALDVTAKSTTITSRGDHAVNFEGRECLSCHAAGMKYDFVCEKDHGCAPLSIGDEEIAAFQAADPRCTSGQIKDKTRKNS
tara:strand:- start:720 stop:1415 length:696 start_codon:yes stop_codon:yes gene_type:complete